MLLLILLALLAIILFGVGFAIKWLFILAVVAALLFVISFFMGAAGGRSRGRTPFALEHERADGFVDRGEMAVEELLGVVRLGGDVSSLAQLEHGLLRRGPVAPRARDEEPLVVADRLAVLQRFLDGVREP